MNEEVNILRPAATTVFLRDQDNKLEVLMVERHSDIAFAGGAMVFPGGRVGEGDFASAWRDHADGLAGDQQLAAAMVAAVREAFEETGILLARSEDKLLDAETVQSLQQERSAVEDDDQFFLDLIRGKNLKLACDQLVFFAHWRAPKGFHKRFDTRFFAAHAPKGQSPIADGREAVTTLWASPQQIIDDADRDVRRVIFPTRRNLELIGLGENVQQVLDGAKNRLIEPIEPRVERRGDEQYLVIPSHLGYPICEENMRTAARF